MFTTLQSTTAMRATSDNILCTCTWSRHILRTINIFLNCEVLQKF